MERKSKINNVFYDELSEGWYDDFHHPIALLRAENKIRTPWIIEKIGERMPGSARILDIGCGAGLLTNALAQSGHTVSGIDLSAPSLAVAERHDTTGSVQYQVANAYALPFPDHSFDVVCATDILEHVEEPHRLISEASRVLKEKGLFFFHTFNRNLLSYIVIIKGVEWCVPNTPKNMHVYSLFIKPKELEQLCQNSRLAITDWVGLRPALTGHFFRMVFTRKISPDLSFCFSKSLATGYCGIAKKF